MRTVAIIIARGGSKRIPKKNINLFFGKPIISYSIDLALKSNLFDNVIVSTDSDEIAKIASHYGAQIPFKRPERLASDDATTDEVLSHALQWLNKENKDLRFACCIYPTAPLLKVEYLKIGLKLLRETGATSAISVTQFSYPIFRSLKINESGRLEMYWPKYLKSPSQDLPKAYHDAGQFYWVDVDKYLEEQQVFSIDSIPVMIPPELIQDIDTSDDWKMAEKLYKISRDN